MKIGFVTIKEADTFLSAWIESGSWKFAKTYPATDGTVSINGNSLVGTNTAFTTSLAVNQYAKVDDYIFKIVSIASDSEATIDKTFGSITGELYKLTPAEYAEEAIDLKQKIQALFYSYNKLVISPFYSLKIPSDGVTPENIKNAQILLALNYLETKILKTIRENIHAKNQNEGVLDYSVSDMSYTYRANTPGAKTNAFPQDVQEFLNEYKTTNQMIHPGRAGNPVESVSIPFEVYNQWLRYLTV